MNRLKFRVWIPRIKKLSYDNFWISHTGKVYCISTPDLIYGKQHLLSLDDVEQVKDYVIQQFTGVLDSKGREIYEGDIVFFYDRYYEVKNGLYCHDDDTLNGDYLLEEVGSFMDFGISVANIHSSDLCVCGNIFENPELLK